MLVGLLTMASFVTKNLKIIKNNKSYDCSSLSLGKGWIRVLKVIKYSFSSTPSPSPYNSFFYSVWTHTTVLKLILDQWV